MKVPVHAGSLDRAFAAAGQRLCNSPPAEPKNINGRAAIHILWQNHDNVTSPSDNSSER